MHDPDTLAFEIKYPWYKYKPGEDKTWPKGYRETFIQIWHHDPQKGPGGDDSCGWFMRAHHGDKEVWAKIERKFKYNWNQVFDSEATGKHYERGWFNSVTQELNGPRTSVGLDMFRCALWVVFAQDRAMSNKFLRKHLHNILSFCDNSVDCLFGSWDFGHAAEIAAKPRELEDAIHSMSGCVYGWILRETRPWYKHPRWHVHHWRVNCVPWYRIKRWFTQRCKDCGKRISPRDHGVVCHSWDGDGPLSCGKCSGGHVAVTDPAAKGVANGG